MKVAISLLALTLSFGAFAGAVPCKSQAYTAIYERYIYDSPDAIVSLTSKYKPYVSGDEAIFVVTVSDLESGQSTLMSAIMDAKTCKVKAVN
ncbi:hypothetical protein DOM21_11180 [Bacteriovorax stolpii]|uniref:hypothetical protein n=1 Tax=Bacteriovorax stolpii TaxID=960 RepID=UPI00115ACA74|nr:hypothetical protein [Bacteriovorax stolpii]QDK41998.1 hypothetical protein DOM21_11180 [Bacteriovorax stolpii]